MKTYLIYIKSHDEAPDFEIEMEAKNFQDLKKKFESRFDYDLQESDVVNEEELQEYLHNDYLEANATGN